MAAHTGERDFNTRREVSVDRPHQNSDGSSFLAQLGLHIRSAGAVDKRSRTSKFNSSTDHPTICLVVEGVGRMFGSLNPVRVVNQQ